MMKVESTGLLLKRPAIAAVMTFLFCLLASHSALFAQDIPLPFCSDKWFLERLGYPAGKHSAGLDVNSAGLVAGTQGDPTFGDPIGHAFLFWRPLGRIDLGTLGGDYSWATAVNANNQVTGASLTAYGFTHAFRFTGAGMADLGFLNGGGTYSEGLDINSQGDVVGVADNINFKRRAFLWKPGMGMMDLGTLAAGEQSQANGINDSGQVAGRSEFLAGQRNMHAFRYSGGVMTDVGTLGGMNSEASRINNSAQMVGWSNDAAANAHAALWTPGQPPRDLHPAGIDIDLSWSLATDINNQGIIVGEVWIGSQQNGSMHAVRWSYDPGTAKYVMWDLNNLRPAGATYVLVKATGISDSGRISGKLRHADGTEEAFLLTPVNVKTLRYASDTVVGGAAVPATVTLTNDPPVDFSVTIVDRHNAAYAPSSVLVEGGESSATFTLNTSLPAGTVAGSFEVRPSSALGACSGVSRTLTVVPITVPPPPIKK